MTSLWWLLVYLFQLSCHVLCHIIVDFKNVLFLQGIEKQR